MARMTTPSSPMALAPVAPANEDFTTIEVAKMLGLAVRSVQLMVDRGELSAWKTPGGHRRISRSSVEKVLAQRNQGGAVTQDAVTFAHKPAGQPHQQRVLLIEDSMHYQNLVSLLLRQHFPQLLMGQSGFIDDAFDLEALIGALDIE